MKTHAKLNEIRLHEVKPAGWLKKTLECEKNGITGHLHEIGYPYDTNCWQYKSLAEGGYAQWWPYEQNAYRIDSVVRMSALLDEMESYEKLVKADVDASLDTEGFIGPEELKGEGRGYRWPMAVYFRALYALWSKTGDEFYLNKIREHYHADSNDYSAWRNIVNVESMLKVYEQTGDEKLFEKAKEAFLKYSQNSENDEALCKLEGNVPIRDHGVTFNETVKLYALMYIFTGDKRYIEAAETAYDRVEEFHMLPSGVHSSNEFLCGNETWRDYESCDITDFTWSLGYMLEATGDAKYADRIERAIVNAFFGSTAFDFKAIQYQSWVNQAYSTRNATRTNAWRDTPRIAYQPHHYPECCVGNIGRAIPNYVLRMYQKYENGIAVSLYGDSEFASDGIRIVQSGNYPYEFATELDVKTDHRFELKLRIPQWSNGYKLSVNGAEVAKDVQNGYVTLAVESDSKIKVEFTPTFKPHTTSDGGVYFTYGPFVMTLKIKEKVEVDPEEPRQTKDFPAYKITPESDWSYAVSGWENPVISFNEKESDPLWSYIPFQIKIVAKKLNNWDMVTWEKRDYTKEGKIAPNEGFDKKFKDCGASHVTEDNVVMPDIPSTDFVNANLGDDEEITLIPFGCSNLRVTVFPKYTLYK